MHGLVLVAGKYQKLSPRPPPPFIVLEGRTIFEWQLLALKQVCDTVTVVLGRGFVDNKDENRSWETPSPFRGRVTVRQNGIRNSLPHVHERKVRAFIGDGHGVDVSVVVVPDWEDIGTAACLRRGLADITGHLLVLEGLTIIRPATIEGFVAEWESRLSEKEWSVVGIRPGPQESGQAVCWNVDGTITGYGRVSGHDVVGLYLIHGRHLQLAEHILRSCTEQSIPVLLPSIETTYLPVPASDYQEIETPEDYRVATQMVRSWDGHPTDRHPPSSR